MKYFGLVALLGWYSTPLIAEIKLGDRPPEIRFDKLLPEQPVTGARFEALAGKVVVLEMWATWCGPCVGAIPHLNELQAKFKDRPVVFLSVTDEEPAVVEAFLKDKPIGGLVGIAHTESPLKLYDTQGIPATFLIDATGKLVASTDPQVLSVSMLEDLIAGRKLPPVELTIRPAGANPDPSYLGRNSMNLTSRTLPDIVSELWGVRQSRITVEGLDVSVTYDLSLSIPGATAENFQAWARDVVAAAFHFKVTRQTRETDVWILAQTQVKPVALEPAGTISDLTNLGLHPETPPALGSFLKLVYSDVRFIAEALEFAAKKPVIDETGIAGKYDFHVSFDNPNSGGLIEAMRKAGFKVEPVRRKIEFLMVSGVQ